MAAQLTRSICALQQFALFRHLCAKSIRYDVARFISLDHVKQVPSAVMPFVMSDSSYKSTTKSELNVPELVFSDSAICTSFTKLQSCALPDVLLQYKTVCSQSTFYNTNSTNVNSACTMNNWRMTSTFHLLNSRSGTYAQEVNDRFKHKRNFHTSPRNNIHPVILIVVQQGARLVSIIGGRTFRNWWRNLTPSQKQEYKDRILKRRSIIATAVALLVLASIGHYYGHLQSTPVTNRRRYLAFTRQQFLKIAEFEYEQEFEKVKDKIVPVTHPSYRIISNIVSRLINGNQDLDFLRQQKWTILVVDTEEANAAVLPTGHIFVNLGMMKVTQNDDQLAVVLGHEMAHAILDHGAEMVSYSTALNFFIIVVMAAVWAFMPSDGIALVTQWFYKSVISIILHLPYSRKLELEADEVGLRLTAKACYDIRESPVFWTLMSLNAQEGGNVEVPEWISTHPASVYRAEVLETLIPKAIKEREFCNCPALPAKDPRERACTVSNNTKETVSRTALPVVSPADPPKH